MSALATLVALVGALYLVVGSAGEPIGEAESMSELVPDLSTTSTAADVRVLNESVTSLAPDTDLKGDPVEDHYSTTTTTTTTVAIAASALASDTSSETTTTVEEEESPPPTSGTEAHFDSGAESDFTGRINNLRSSNGLGPLSRSGSLDSEARSWARTLGERGALSHSGLGRLLPPWLAAAENVATGGDVSSVFGGLAGSGGHLGNMVGDYTHMGIGVWVDPTGRIWTVHIFAR
jgi:uncharacterized protein YkwD